ncbi:hypothetical protein SAMN02799630_04548 [Paenibacillus sp. UNCCL117]|uniref:hypothetical protein n=1 Tax=unclassified Paenibacillus TaxID=185978 RepID=UPI00088CBEA7|nr:MULTISPECIES: hypothetical protein [unclassified Paenibacillus]SDD64730.1 hypothetical protein SAMN04488602_11192 [Paenibacillus sp. cl123]SFW58263.1 hypothetical protein SAMN02799630_04548 [Paenibacillus sp. UNCCL117]
MASGGTGFAAYAQSSESEAEVAVSASAQTTSAIGAANTQGASYVQDRFGLKLTAAPTKGEMVVAVARLLAASQTSAPAPSPAPAGGAAAAANPFSDLAADSALYEAAVALHGQGILSSGALQGDARLTQGTAVYIVLKAAGLKELAYTYPDAKTQTALGKLGIADRSVYGLTRQASQELAAAVDTGLLPQAAFDPSAPASAVFAEELLERLLSVRGEAKRYIGSTSEDDIFAKVHAAFDTHNLIQVPELQAIVDEALKQGLVTGYNLKDDRYTAHFDEARALTYGHSDLTHAIQLIGLLRSENLQAKVQLEPKTSAFLYLKEWGEPQQSDDYKVVQIENGNYIAYAKEYDLAFEFDTVEQKDKFHSVIEAYAKKDSDDEPGLIAGSWWQPLYYSLRKLPAYIEIANNRIDQGHYYAQSFSLPEQSAEIAEGLKKLKAGLQVNSYRFWVDEPFYNYLLGESK